MAGIATNQSTHNEELAEVSGFRRRSSRTGMEPFENIVVHARRANSEPDWPLAAPVGVLICMMTRSVRTAGEAIGWR